MPSLKIRPFLPRDTASVIALWRACDLVRPVNDPKKDIARKRRVRAGWFLVAIAERQLIGSIMVGYEGHRGWINYLAVAPEARRRGYGRQLMAAAERRLRAAGCPKINLQVRRSNRGVIAFYRALGFGVDPVISLGKRLIQDHSP